MLADKVNSLLPHQFYLPQERAASTWICTILAFLSLASTVVSMSGGMNEVTDLKDERVVAAANFAVVRVASSGQSYSFMENVKSKQVGDLQVVIVRAFQQVVAGLKYRMVLLVQDGNDECLGAFGVEIFDEFGNLSVTQWAKETTCEKAYAFIKNKDQFGQDGGEGGN